MNTTKTILRKVSYTFLLLALSLVASNNLSAQNPEVGSITLQSPSTQNTNSTFLSWEVQFDKIIDNNTIELKDFVLSRFGGSTATGTLSSISGTGNTYIVNVTGASGDGSLRLDFVGEVSDFNGNNSQNSFEGEHYILDNTKPTVLSINRFSPANQTTNATSLQWVVTFSEQINTGTLTTSDFTKSGSPSGTISSITNLGSNQFRVNMTSVSGNGTINLRFTGAVNDLVGNVSSGSFTTGQTYTIDQTAPKISDIVRQNPSSQTTNATTLEWRITFSESINSSTLTTSDFELFGSPNGTISSVSGSGSTYTVTVTNVSGDGELYLDFSGSITDLVGNTTTTTFFNNNPYIIDNTNPTVISITRLNPGQINTNANTLQWNVRTSESINSSTLSVSDFSLRTFGTNGNISSVSGSGSSYIVTVNNVTGDGEIYLDFTGSITDLVGNVGSTPFNKGQQYILDNTAPSILNVHIQSTNSNPEVVRTGENVEVTFEISEDFGITNAEVEGNTDVTTSTNDQNGRYFGEVVYTMKSSDFAGNVEFEIRVTDNVGNSTVFNATTDNSFVIFEKTPPEIFIIDQPKDVIECEGSIDQYLFIIAAPTDRYFRIAYRWYKDGKPVTQGTLDNGILALDTLDFGMSGEYYAEIWAIDDQLPGSTAEAKRITGSVYSAPANLYVLQRPSFMSNIKNVTANEGVDVSITFDANIYGEHNMDDPTYWTQIQWYRGDDALVDDERYEGTQSSILTINDLMTTDYADNYRVRLIGNCDTIWSNNFAISSEPMANITTQPLNAEGCLNDKVQFLVDAEATQAGVLLAYQWTVDGVNIVDEANKFSGANTSTLEVTLNPALGYDGTEEFVCVISPIGFPDNTVSSDPVMITWKMPPFITVDLMNDYSEEEGNSLELYITADGSNLSYTWTKDGADLGVDNDTLSLTDLALADAGQYTVTVTNECGDAVSRVSTVVVTQGPVVTNIPLEDRIGLHQNYPNPFGESTTISWNSQAGGYATMIITDMLGNKVATIFEKNINAGFDKVSINSSELNLSSGTYYLTFRLNNTVQTRQITIVK